MLVKHRPAGTRLWNRPAVPKPEQQKQALLDSRHVPATDHWLPFGFTLVWNLSGTATVRQRAHQGSYLPRRRTFSESCEETNPIQLLKGQVLWDWVETVRRLSEAQTQIWKETSRFLPSRIRIRMNVFSCLWYKNISRSCTYFTVMFEF